MQSQWLIATSNCNVSFRSCVVAGRLFLQPNECALMSKVGPFVSFAYFDNISFKKDNREYLMPLFRNVFNGLINTYLLLSLKSEKQIFINICTCIISTMYLQLSLKLLWQNHLSKQQQWTLRVGRNFPTQENNLVPWPVGRAWWEEN